MNRLPHVLAGGDVLGDFTFADQATLVSHSLAKLPPGETGGTLGRTPARAHFRIWVRGSGRHLQSSSPVPSLPCAWDQEQLVPVPTI